MKLQARKENIAMQEAGNEVMVYDLAVNKAYLLNETSAFVWQMCNGENELSSISLALAKKTKQSVNEDIVKVAIDQLKSFDLMQEAPNFFSRTNRRTIIKQAGLATMVALPMITAIVAPRAANAASSSVRTSGCYEIGECGTGRFCPPGCNLDASQQFQLHGNATCTQSFGVAGVNCATSPNDSTNQYFKRIS